jgi:hypothetical protein
MREVTLRDGRGTADGRTEPQHCNDQKRNDGFSRRRTDTSLLLAISARDEAPKWVFVNTSLELSSSDGANPWFIRETPWLRFWVVAVFAAFCGHLRFPGSLRS